MVDLDKLIELEAGATIGPWRNDIADSYSPLRGPMGETIADFDCDEPDTAQGKHNCLFVEEMRNNIRPLCEELKAARKVVEAAREVAKRFTPASPDDIYALVTALKELGGEK